MNKFVPIVAIAIVVGVGGFVGGMHYAKSKTPAAGNLRSSFSAGQGRGNFGNASSTARFGGQRGAGAVMGDVLAKDATSVTIKLADGGSKIVFYSTSTQFMKSSEGSIADIEVGKPVFINGSTNSDGTVTAQNIQVGRPIFSVMNP